MASNNLVFLAGNVVQPPYFDRVGKDERPYLRLYLAVDRPGKDRGADFVRVVGYDDTALWYPHLSPGTRLAVLPGRIQTRKIKKRGQRETVVEVVASGFNPLERIDWELGREFLAELGIEEWHESPENNHVFLMGNLTKAPRYDLVARDEREPLPFLCCYVAANRTGGGADFVRVVAYGNLAQLSWPYLRAGSEVACTGRLRVRKYTTREGDRRTVVEVVAATITFVRNIDWEGGDAARKQILADREQVGE